MFEQLVQDLMALADASGHSVATAESCTGGMIAAAITDVAGSSRLLDRGFVTYSNEAKQQMLGVDEATLIAHGAVSQATAHQMVVGALARSAASLAVAVTGIAGPGGASDRKPVGLVYIACLREGSVPLVERHLFPGDRASVRAATTKRALELLIEAARIR